MCCLICLMLSVVSCNISDIENENPIALNESQLKTERVFFKDWEDFGKEYSKEYGFTEGEIIELIEGHFEHDNGLYTEDQTAPSIWDEKQKDFESIYHLFGNEFENFLDCEVVS